MARFMLIAFAALYVLFMIYRMMNGYRMSLIDWVAFLLASLATGSMIYYIFTTN